MNKILVVVDMQNDFIDGALGTPEAQAIVPKVVEKIESWDGSIVTTQDFHTENYLSTQEGKRLPIVHCRYDTDGHQLHPSVKEVVHPKIEMGGMYFKEGFGSDDLAKDLSDTIRHGEPLGFKIDEIHLCGLCTDICVLANAITIKTFCPEARIVVDASCCAGTTPEAHEIALKAMRQCQIDIENWELKT